MTNQLPQNSFEQLQNTNQYYEPEDFDAERDFYSDAEKDHEQVEKELDFT